jgi:hypothetical protein
MMNNILVFLSLILLISPGEVKEGLREGYGTYNYTNGDKYDGQWQGNLKHGVGYFYYNNGELYIGQWYDFSPFFKNQGHITRKTDKGCISTSKAIGSMV